MMSTTDKQSRYMIAIVPPEPLYSEIHELKESLGREYHTKAAIRRPVHITLIQPFDAPQSQEQTFVKFITRFAAKHQPFDIKLDGFGEFHQGTIFIKPVENADLRKLYKDLSKEFASVYARVDRGPSYGFQPHITVAYQDLSRPMFEKAWHELGDKIFRRRFLLENISLMRNDMGWKTIAKGILGAGGSSDNLSLF